MEKVETTLMLLRKNDEILLAMKKRGFGVGKFNGVGGKLKIGETPEMAMLRETEEEIGVVPSKYEKVGLLDFVEFYKGEKVNIVTHLYTASEWEGEPKESEEMKPQWVGVNEIPYDKMFVDDKYWLPLVLEGKKLDVFFEFDEDWNVISKRIDEI
jgi:mutator protein MutT